MLRAVLWKSGFWFGSYSVPMIGRPRRAMSRFERDSILTTSAPKSDSTCPQIEPAQTMPRSSTRTPARMSSVAGRSAVR